MDFENFRTILELAEFVIGGYCFILYRNFAAVQKKADEVASSLAEFKLHCSETFSTKNDLSKAIEQFSRSIDAVFAKLERIEDKLDNKQDKAP